MEYIKSPINYTGGKFKLLKDIVPMFPKEIDTFVDLFGGSGTVVLNVDAKNKIYNELNPSIYDIVEVFKIHNKEEIINHITSRGLEFNLNKKTIAAKDRNEEIKENYYKFRDYLNYESKTRALDLLTIHYYAFNNLVRENKNGLFNTPYGNRSFVLDKHKSSIDNACVKFKDIEICNKDFRNIELNSLNHRDFVYLDPPYLLSCAEYNKLWGKDIEEEMYDLCDRLTTQGVKWAMSNMLYHKGKEHELLNKWAKDNNYYIYDVNTKYNGWISVKNEDYNKTKEILITNYSVVVESEGIA